MSERAMLIDELRAIQREHGYLPAAALRALSERARIPLRRPRSGELLSALPAHGATRGRRARLRRHVVPSPRRRRAQPLAGSPPRRPRALRRRRAPGVVSRTVRSGAGRLHQRRHRPGADAGPADGSGRRGGGGRRAAAYGEHARFHPARDPPLRGGRPLRGAARPPGQSRHRRRAHHAQGQRASRARGRGLSDRGQVGDRPGRRRPREVRRLQRGRERAGYDQGPLPHGARSPPRARGHDPGGHGDGRPHRDHLHPPRVRSPGGGAAARDRRLPTARPPRCRRARRSRALRREPLRQPRRLHLRRGIGAAGGARGQARGAAQQAAVPGHARALAKAHGHQQRGDVRPGAADPDDRRRGVQTSGAGRRGGPEVRGRERSRRAPGRVRDRDGHPGA